MAKTHYSDFVSYLVRDTFKNPPRLPNSPAVPILSLYSEPDISIIRLFYWEHIKPDTIAKSLSTSQNHVWFVIDQLEQSIARKAGITDDQYR